ncbi:MAG: glycosyltransferase family 39 protein, partial [Candidatus Omnitrophica bacterium]|nr:glycosyltransferase family 39 protein [Candidatus Omnitrophota bacterium]
MKDSKDIKQIVILLLLAYFCFMFGNGLISLTIPDEVFYAQTAKEMLQQHSWMTPYLFGQPQFEKPIFLYWLLKLGFLTFGINSFAARFFPSLFGMIGVVAVYLLGRIGFKDKQKAFISAVVLMTCGLYLGLARTVFTDLIFGVFILLALLSFYGGYIFEKIKGTGICLFFIFSALAVLTKGPLGLIIPGLTVASFLFIKKNVRFLINRYFVWGLLVFSLICLPWYVLMFKLYGNNFIREFFYNDHFRRIIEAEHHGNDTWYFYPFSMVSCIFPWSVFLVISLFSLPKHLKQKNNLFYIFLLCLVTVVFVVFQSAHSKLISYIFPLFPALALFTGGFIADLLVQEKPSRLVYSALLFSLSSIFLVPAALIVVSIGFKDYLTSYLSWPGMLNLFIFIFLVYGLFMLFWILRKKLLKSIYGVALFVPLMLYLIAFLHQDIEPYLSPKKTCEYLLKNYKIDNIILSSKFFVRGVKYYTDKEVAVIDMPGTPFFSAHPIPFLNTPD